MEIPPAESVFDVAEWFLDTALNDGEYLQPIKMQYLMYLAQGYYAAITKGRRFVPSVFKATDRGPIEPNSYRLYATDRPTLSYMSADKKTISFMQTIWKRFGAYSPDYLYRLISTHAPYAEAFAEGDKTEISLEKMADFYANGTKDTTMPMAQTLSGTRVLRSQSGKAVAVKKWLPQKK